MTDPVASTSPSALCSIAVCDRPAHRAGLCIFHANHQALCEEQQLALSITDRSLREWLS